MPTFALGVLIGMFVIRAISKWSHFDVEAEAFVNGYAQGYDDAERKRPRQWEPWDALRWRSRYPELQSSYAGQEVE